jgi:ATP-dependent phosphofructokinase / diphosphate-dependent phosphofructokinase
MKRIAILTAGGDTPALNATIHGAVTRANQHKIEVIGLLQGYDSLFHPNLPHVQLNPLYSEIPELDPTQGGTILGSSRRYVCEEDTDMIPDVCGRLGRLGVEGLLCIGGDGTMNGMQPLCDRLPLVLAPKTIDNDLGLNYPHEPDKWTRQPDPKNSGKYIYQAKSDREHGPDPFRLDQMVNYATPGFATAVFVTASGVQRIRTTAESHRRIAIIEVMGRDSGFISLGSTYGQPDIVLIPESAIVMDQLVERVREIYDHQRNVVIICGEGITDEHGVPFGAARATSDPAGNLLLTGAAEQLRHCLVEAMGDSYFRERGLQDSARATIFTRKVGHTQRGGRPVQFDRFHAAQLGGKAVDMLLAGQNNAVAVLQYNERDGFRVESCEGNSLRDRWGVIHARRVHSSFYDPQRMQISPIGIEYLLPIFTNAIGADDTEHIRETLFDSGNLYRRYHSVNIDIQKRTRYL